MPGSRASPMARSVRATRRPAALSFSSSSSLPIVIGPNTSEVRPDHGLADDLAVFQGLEGLAPAVQRVFGMDAGPEFAGFGHAPDGFQVLAAPLGELAAV